MNRKGVYETDFRVSGNDLEPFCFDVFVLGAVKFRATGVVHKGGSAKPSADAGARRRNDAR